ncbi:sensor histidine kinase [Algoriphagus terrigena]|uniref:sensor histidine kinase n=1 Tax=Algoriphagus terrigena TaxID=344884 RepID=UPI001B7FE507|nr:ATP-binding protein [Algoriphagus terrigena]
MLLFQNAVLVFMATLITSVVFIVDLNTSSTVAVAGMYSVVILYSWLLPGKFASIYTAAVCTVLTIVAAIRTNVFTTTADNLSGINAVIALVVIWTCVTLVFLAKSSFSSLEGINAQLSERSNTLLEKLKELDAKQDELSEKKVQLEKLNADLVVKNRELERFTSIASHDLQEPLRTIGNMTQLIAKKYYPNFDDQGKRMLDYVTSATSRMTTLIRGLLEFSRIGIKRETQPVNCHELVNNIVLDFDSSLKASKGTIKVNELPVVLGNPVELRMLFQNLISNGLKFSDKSVLPVIELSAKDIGSHIEFCVRDNGIGIDQTDYEKIFFIFQRLHPTEQYEGMGLGLAYCRKIVELHGGKIWIDSKKNQGSAFYFTLTKIK